MADQQVRPIEQVQLDWRMVESGVDILANYRKKSKTTLRREIASYHAGKTSTWQQLKRNTNTTLAKTYIVQHSVLMLNDDYYAEFNKIVQCLKNGESIYEATLNAIK
jgi:hypothetical protein